MERLHLDKRGDSKDSRLTWVRFEVLPGVPKGLDGKTVGLRTLCCPKHRINLLAAIAKTPPARVLEEKPAKGGVCAS